MAAAKLPPLEPRLYINNELVDARSGKTLPIINPYDGSLVGDIQVAGEEDIDIAVAAAEKAFRGEWAKYSGVQRQTCLLKLADLVEERIAELSLYDALCMGTPKLLTSYGILPASVNILRSFAGWADKIPGGSFKNDGDGFYKIVEHVPFGVVTVIGSFNATYLYLLVGIGHAIATGNTLIYKASEKSPFAATAIAPLIAKAGFPPGVINIVNGDGSTGALLASHMKIRMLCFTGSAPVGHQIMELAAKSNLKKVVLELGGKAPAIVFDDANFDHALESCTDHFLRLTGQSCMAGTRVLVQRGISDRFVKAMRQRFEQLDRTIGGNPIDDGVFIGPLVDTKSMERFLDRVNAAKESSELVYGGQRKGNTGAFVSPAMFVNSTSDSTVWRDEIFGPVLVVKTFDTEEEAIELANDTEYGLAALIFTSNLSRALRVSKECDVGIVVVNSTAIGDHQGSFGGHKGSGLGVQCGLPGLLEFMETKTIKINLMV